MKRLEIVKLLLEKGADINSTRAVVGLTPLHWAAYHDDAELVRYLLQKGALQKESTAGSMPVDIAGFMGCKKVLKVFMEHAAAKFEKIHGNGGDGTVDLNSLVKKPVVDEVAILSQMEKSEKTGQYKV